MKQKNSAGILLFKKRKDDIEVFLIHPGGPFFRNKDDGSWSIPKGLIEEGEDGQAAALREFEEETGCRPEGALISLTPVRMKSGKMVLAWAVEGDCDAGAITSNTFTLEWPPWSGRIQEFPEADRAAWFTIDQGLRKINQAQAPLLKELTELL